MNLLQVLVLSVVQGITEFLPVSSSGHLCFLPKLMNWVDQGQEMDVALHVGTLFAVLVYFRKDIFLAFKGCFSLVNRKNDEGSSLVKALIAGTVPVVIAGFILSANPVEALRSVKVIGISLLFFGVVLYLADKKGAEEKELENITLKDGLIIGLFQVLALVPGTSRSGITMTAARFLGYKRTEAARFSLLLAVPAIGGAGLLTAIKIIKLGSTELTHFAFIGVIASFLAGLAAIWLMMKWLKKSSFTPFAIYRVILGAGLIVYGFGLL